MVKHQIFFFGLVVTLELGMGIALGNSILLYIFFLKINLRVRFQISAVGKSGGVLRRYIGLVPSDMGAHVYGRRERFIARTSKVHISTFSL